MHGEAFAFVRTAAGLMGTPDCVIECGSRNVNGSARDAFPGVPWYGVDITEGPGVDCVADFTTWAAQISTTVDAVVCCEVLEHAPQPAAILYAAASLVRPGGWLLVTCATHPRAEHSAAHGGPLAPGEHYRNLTYPELLADASDAGFRRVMDECHRDRGDLYYLGRRRDD